MGMLTSVTMVRSPQSSVMHLGYGLRLTTKRPHRLQRVQVVTESRPRPICGPWHGWVAYGLSCLCDLLLRFGQPLRSSLRLICIVFGQHLIQRGAFVEAGTNDHAAHSADNVTPIKTQKFLAGFLEAAPVAHGCGPCPGQGVVRDTLSETSCDNIAKWWTLRMRNTVEESLWRANEVFIVISDVESSMKLMSPFYCSETVQTAVKLIWYTLWRNL